MIYVDPYSRIGLHRGYTDDLPTMSNENRVKFTAGRIRDFLCDPTKAQTFFWDSEAPGLAVRVTPAGAKTYVFQAKLAGNALRVKVGDTRTWGIDEARAEARRMRALVDQGIDPRQEKADRIAVIEAQAEETRREAVTVSDAWKAYLKARSPKWSERHLQNHMALAKPGGEPRGRGRRKGEPTTTLPGPIHSLMEKPLRDLDSDTVKGWLETQAARGPTQASQAYRALRAFLGWCADRAEYRDQVRPDACTARETRDALPKPRAKDDCLQREMLKAWFERVRAIGNPAISAFLQTALLTGARRTELFSLTWADVDFQWRSMTIHDKVEGERVIPLTPYIASLLAALPRRNEWVFSSPTSADGRLQEPRIQHVKALAAAGLPHVSIHGLRRSFGTLSEWCEAPVGVVAQIMGHKPSAIAEKHYRRRPLDLLRMWHTKIEGWILEQAGIDQPTEGTAMLKVVA